MHNQTRWEVKHTLACVLGCRLHACWNRFNRSKQIFSTSCLCCINCGVNIIGGLDLIITLLDWCWLWLGFRFLFRKSLQGKSSLIFRFLFTLLFSFNKRLSLEVPQRLKGVPTKSTSSLPTRRKLIPLRPSTSKISPKRKLIFLLV